MESELLNELQNKLKYYESIPAKLSNQGVFNLDLEYPDPRYNSTGLLKNIHFSEGKLWHSDLVLGKNGFGCDIEDFDDVELLPVNINSYTSSLKKRIVVTGYCDDKEFTIKEYTISKYGIFHWQNILHDLGSQRIELLPFWFCELCFKAHIWLWSEDFENGKFKFNTKDSIL